MTDNGQAVVDAFFKAMQTGSASEEDLMALFAEDAEYVEPFGGEPRRHVGKPQIRAAFRSGWDNPIPDMRLTLHRVDVERDELVTDWTCTSPVFPGPMRGADRFTLRDGRIQRLETRLVGTAETGSDASS